MVDYSRLNPLFSLCGLNCGLCPMRIGVYCPGCGGGEGHQPCAIVRCSQRHGDVEYCFLCNEYPCEKYNGATDFDSFITHRNMFSDFAKAKRAGLPTYQEELDDKMLILRALLAHYNDGRHKSLFCVAVNLLELQDLKAIMSRLAESCDCNGPLKEKAAAAAHLMQDAAEKSGISLKLRREKRAPQL